MFWFHITDAVKSKVKSLVSDDSKPPTCFIRCQLILISNHNNNIIATVYCKDCFKKAGTATFSFKEGSWELVDFEAADCQCNKQMVNDESQVSNMQI